MENYFSCCAIFHSNLYRTTTTFRMESVLCTLPQLCINELVNKPGSNTDSCFSVLCSQGKFLNDFCLRRGRDLAWDVTFFGHKYSEIDISVSKLLPNLWGFRFRKIWFRKKSLGFGFGKIWSRKKVSVSVSENLVSAKSLGFGFGKSGLGKEKIQITRTVL